MLTDTDVFFSIYCDTCNTIAKDARNSVELLSDGKPLDCNRGLDVGTYRNVSLSFCAPTVDDFLKSQNIDRSAWDQVISKQVRNNFLISAAHLGFVANAFFCVVCF